MGFFAVKFWVLLEALGIFGVLIFAPIRSSPSLEIREPRGVGFIHVAQLVKHRIGMNTEFFSNSAVDAFGNIFRDSFSNYGTESD